MKFKYETIVGAEDFNSLFLPQRQAIDKMKFIPSFPMKKLPLIVLLLISSLSAFAKEQEEFHMPHRMSNIRTDCLTV